MRRALFLLVALFGCKSSSSDTPAPANDAGSETSGVESCYEAPALDSAAVSAPKSPRIQYVNPFVGTGGVGFGVGSAFPGPQRPFGLARPSPDTLGKSGEAATFSHCSGYAYDDATISGFSLTRMHGTGIVDYGTIGIMPTVGITPAKLTTKTRRTAFAKSSEKASPGFYQVTLDGGVGVELTATDHVAVERYSFPKGSDANVLVDVGHALPDVTIADGAISIDAAKGEVSGFAKFVGGYSGRFGGMPVYFVGRFSRPFVKSGTWKAGALDTATSQTGNDTGAYFAFDASTDTTVTAAFAVSFTDVAHARANLDAEQASIDFDATRKAAEDQWEKALGRVDIVGRERDLRIFYTAMYHALLMPTLGSDVDGTYVGMDDMQHAVSGARYYTDLSLWDTYRALHSWLSLVFPEYQRDMVRSMILMAQQGGADPKWPLGIGETGGMVGDSAAVVITDSYLRGVRDFDTAAAWSVLERNATQQLPHDGRDHIDEYDKNGYIAIESGGSSGATTLEFAFDDAALANFAHALGNAAAEDRFRKRSANWKNLWDAQSGFLLGRHKDGSFPRDDDPTAWQGYWAEGDTWQYTWFVPHDVPGLADVMGGREKFLSRLDDFFAQSTCQLKIRLAPKPYYWHSNEVVLFVPWAFAELDDAARSAKWVRWALAGEYGDGPDGIPGNDDSGTMSAWYLFSSLGIFPRVGTSEYLLGAPLFPKSTLHLPGGDLTITADGAPNAERPTAFALGGAPLARPRVDHAQIGKGGALTITLAAQ